MLGPAAAPSPLRMCGVEGHEGRRNDVVYCHPSERAETATTVVFFGGDMQDFTENMRTHRESKNYLKWNLEDTARVIQAHFPDSHIVLVRPARIEYKTFSCYKNFVPCNSCGSPEHTPMHNALRHLERLLQSTSDRLGSMSPEGYRTAIAMSKFSSQVSDDNKIEENEDDQSTPINFWWKEDLNLDLNDLILIGFSKGCVPLNQFLYEFHYLKTLTPDDLSSMAIVGRIRDMYWLDGGHSGGKNTWITSRPLLETLTRLGVKIHVHVSPYQIQDDRRPCIRKEEKMFADLLRRLGASVDRTVHFENMFPNLYMHFDIINVFRQANTSAKETKTSADEQK